MADLVRKRAINVGGRSGAALHLGALEWGGSGPPLILVHATSFCAEVWGPAWEVARAAGLESQRALAIEQRGHGRSDVPSESSAYAWTKLAGDVISVLEAEFASEGPALLIGHSSGGTAVLAAACRDRRGAACGG